MFYHLYLVVTLLRYCSDGSSAPGSPGKVTAYVSGHVLLPCSISVSASSDFPTVEWSKDGLQPDVVFLYRDSCETFEMKNPAFEYRTSLVMRELRTGNVSLRISDVRLSDAGKYKCLKIWKNGFQEHTIVELVVGAVCEPKLSVVSPPSAALTLQCEASCWLTEPQLTFLDDQGNQLQAEDPERDQVAGGCDTLRRRVTLQAETSRVTCRVQHPDINMTRDAEIHIREICSLLTPASCAACFQTLVFVVGLMMVSVIMCGFVVCLLNRHRKCDLGPGRRLSTNPSAVFSDNGAQGGEKLHTDAAPPQAKPLHSNDPVGQRDDASTPQLRAVVCQHSQPTAIRISSQWFSSQRLSASIASDPSATAGGVSRSAGIAVPQNKNRSAVAAVQSAQMKHRRHSSTLSSSSSPVSGSLSKPSLAGSGAQPGPAPTKAQYRPILENTLTANRFSPLADLE